MKQFAITLVAITALAIGLGSPAAQAGAIEQATPVALEATATESGPLRLLSEEQRLGSLVAADGRLCGLTFGGEAFCDTGEQEPTPVLVKAQVRFADLFFALGRLCGRTWGGSGYCESAEAGSAPVQLVDQVLGEQVAFGSFTATATRLCGLSFGGAAYCYGELSADPIRFAEGTSFAALVFNGEQLCGRTYGGKVYCDR